MASGEIWWGSVGESNRLARIENGVQAGDFGVVRTLERDVSYDERYQDFEFCAWYRVEGAQWAMSLGPEQTATQAKFGTLFEVAKAVRRKLGNGPLSPADPQLILLDGLLKKVCLAVRDLHAKGLSVGLLDPFNVMYCSKGGSELSLVLPDAGFRWTVELEKTRSATLSRWEGASSGADQAEIRDFAMLWDVPPSAGSNRIAAAYRRGFSEVDEVRTLARIIVWTLTGEVRQQLPPRGSGEDAFWKQVEREDPVDGNVSKLWLLLDKIIGQEPSFTPNRLSEKFATAFSRVGVIPFFTAATASSPVVTNQNAEPRRRRGAWLYAGGALAASLAGVGVTLGLWGLFHESFKTIWGDPCRVATLCPACGEGSPLYSDFEALKEPFRVLEEAQLNVLADERLPSANAEVFETQLVRLAEIVERLKSAEANANAPGVGEDERQCLAELTERVREDIRELDTPLRLGASGESPVLTRQQALDFARRTEALWALVAVDEPRPEWIANLISVLE